MEDRMLSIGELLSRILDSSPQASSAFKQQLKEREGLTHEQLTQRKVDRYNAEIGTLNADDGYNCDLCKNKGNIAQVSERGGAFYDVYPHCKCMDIRRSILRMKQSGLERVIKEKTFKTFEVKNEWQKELFDMAQAYISDGVKAGKWFFVGGAVGCGKTHICTAIAAKLLYQMPVHYMTWPDVNDKIKAVVNDPEEYARIINPLKNVDVLYIDDLFKPAIGRDGQPEQPTPADIRRTYEIINHRYINKMPTIISSERFTTELLDIDEAIGSRIIECSKGYCLDVSRGRERNWRLA